MSDASDDVIDDARGDVSRDEDEDQYILEGVVTTLNADGSLNVSPMGPRVDRGMHRFVLRPYETSRTLANLLREGEGVLHVTDDVELLARAAVGRLETIPTWFAAKRVRGGVLAEACRWYEFRVASVDQRAPRVDVQCEVVERGTLREFLGFCRAKHAVVEAAILATRVEFLGREVVLEQFTKLQEIVDKTAGRQERLAMEFLTKHVAGEG
jgi:hypothetical protein